MGKILCPLSVSLLLLACCSPVDKTIEKMKPVDYSKVKAIINGKECRMFPGYNCDPDNRTFVGQENGDNVYMCFYSLNMAENYKAKDPKDNDTIYQMDLYLYISKMDFLPGSKYAFNRVNDSSEVWMGHFESGAISSPIMYGETWSFALQEGGADSSCSYVVTNGWVSFGEIDTSPHLLYGGDRLVWKCREAFFEFDAVSDKGKVMHVTEGYCCLD